VLLQSNNIDMHAHGNAHRDGIQFYNQGRTAPSSNITIKGNVIKTDDGQTHGIYFGNADTKGSNLSEFYKNITIEGNTLKTGQMLGIAIGGAQDVAIRNNVVVQTNEFHSKKTVNIPMIILDKDAKSVSLSGNTVLKAPAIGDDGNNWKIVGTLSNTGSKIVSLGATVANAATVSTDDTTTSAAKIATLSTTSLGNGVADDFHFKGTDVSGSKTSAISAHFAEGDTITLGKYDAHTFEDVVGGNAVGNSADGTYVKIDSLTDLQELVASSKALSASVSGDDLRIDIDQASGVHHIELAGLGQDYANTFDSTLF
jgi:hypothetical protein